MIRRLLVIAFASAGLAGCGDSAPRGAAENASRLLAAAVKGDRVAFEAEIDRPAVRDDVRRQMSEVARSRVLDVEGGPSEFALDRMIGPDAVHLVRAGSSQALTTAFAGIELDCVGNLAEARAWLAAHPAPDIALIDLGLPDGSGVELIAEFNRVSPRTVYLLR